jgi:hypothetical protein
VIAPRTFAVSAAGVVSPLSHEQHLRLMGVSPSLSAAVDLLVDDNYPMEEAVKLCKAAEDGGQDPEAWARHFLKLRRTLRNIKS